MIIPDLRINASRLQSRMKEMAQIGAFAGGVGVHRLALSEEDIQARKLLKKWFAELNLTYCCDAAGNMFGIYGDPDHQDSLVIGSHLDTVAYGGRFDGALGVIGALEVCETLIENSLVKDQALVVANFTNEEGVRFTPDMMGSMYASGQCSAEEVHRAVALDNGKSMGDELQHSGFMGSYRLPTPKAFLEIHIEQGPVLESANLDIGVVTGVTGIIWKEITILGQANHAGTTPLHLRKDSGLVAAEIIQYARALSVETEGVITVGRVQFEPNVTNIIPSQVKLTLDIRNTNPERLTSARYKMDEFISRLKQKHQLEIQQKELVNVRPLAFNSQVVNAVKSSTERLSFTCREMASGAGHDAQLMAGCCPSGMIFIPSRNGISHNKDEYSSDEQIEKGVNVLLHSVISLL